MLLFNDYCLNYNLLNLFNQLIRILNQQEQLEIAHHYKLLIKITLKQNTKNRIIINKLINIIKPINKIFNQLINK